MREQIPTPGAGDRPGVVKGVVFDLFGTLVDNHSFPGHPSATWRGMQAEMAAAVAADPIAFVSIWDATWRERATGAFPTVEACIHHLCERLGVDAAPSAVAAAAAVRFDYVRRGLVPRPDAEETLAALNAAGLPIAVISNCIPDVPLLWENTPFAAHIHAPIFSSVVGLMKPDPRIYRLACGRLDVAPEQCLFVADGEGGELAAAAAIGMHATLIRSSYSDPPGFRRPHVEPWNGPEIGYLREVLEMLSV